MRDLDNPAVIERDARLSMDFDELIAKHPEAAPQPLAQSRKLPAKVYGVMALTTVLTFATLTTGYELFFQHQLFA